MMNCPECSIGLPDQTARCPMCQRILSVAPWARKLGVVALFMLPFLVVILVALISQDLESQLFRRQISPTDAYQAALTYLKSTPDMRGAAHFSDGKESSVERWGPTRFRVSGYVDLPSRPGAGLHNSYSCVLHYNGQDRWEVEELHIERVE
jgi:hypothetical protein